VYVEVSNYSNAFLVNRRLDEWVTAERFDMSKLQHKEKKNEKGGSRKTRGQKRKADPGPVDEKDELEKEHEEITKVKNVKFVFFL
jgi:hypothetical protein